jgi:uncharacterized protein (DUF58 family)
MLSHELIRKIRKIEIHTRRLVNESFAGQYLASFKGRGIEFDEVREYQPGDDIRTIDWNVTARMGAPFVKQYIEERELTVMLAFDASASGLFGTVERFKRELCAELAAVLAFSAISNNDKVGLLVFTNEVELYIPPRKGRRHVLRLIHELLAFEPAGRATDVNLALETLNRTLKRSTIIFLLSDLALPLDPPDAFNQLQQTMRVTNLHHDLVAVTVHDPLEQNWPKAGLVQLQDAENGHQIIVNTNNHTWQTAFETRSNKITTRREQLLQRARVDHILIMTGEDYVPALLAFFKRRGKRWGR